MKKTLKLLLLTLMFSLASCADRRYDADELFMLQAFGYREPTQNLEQRMVNLEAQIY
jgi:hypothetical protein